MKTPPPVSAKTLARFHASAPKFVDETAIATVWKVTCRGGEHAALKIYKNRDMGNERCGYTFLKALQGRGGAKVYALSGDALLLEWLEGPSLGDLSRQGQDEMAGAELVSTANRIHQEEVSPSGGFPPLADWFEALFQVKISPACKPQFRQNIERCKGLARHLLSTATEIRPLHGDLHHDNIRLGARGYCAFDAKGVLGERTYELANAFRNPKGAPELVRDPARIRRLASSWSRTFDVNEHRLLQWAAVKCALSISWRNSEVGEDAEADVLGLFLHEVENS